MKYNLFEINERLQNGEITSEQAHKELLVLFDAVKQGEQYHCELYDFVRQKKRCEKQCDSCKWMSKQLYDALLADKIENQLLIQRVSQQRELLVCPNNEQHVVKKDDDNKYCMVCGILN